MGIAILSLSRYIVIGASVVNNDGTANYSIFLGELLSWLILIIGAAMSATFLKNIDLDYISRLILLIEKYW